MSILLNVLLVFYVIITVLMILIILMQRPKSEGLGAAFGGGVTDNLFGAQTSNVLTKITGWLAGTFFFLTFALSVAYAHRSGGSGALRQELMKTAPPVSATSPAPGASVAPFMPVDGLAAGAAPAGDQVPPAAVQANSPTGADMAVGAVEPVPPPGNTVAPNASASPGKP